MAFLIACSIIYFLQSCPRSHVLISMAANHWASQWLIIYTMSAKWQIKKSTIYNTCLIWCTLDFRKKTKTLYDESDRINSVFAAGLSNQKQPVVCKKNVMLPYANWLIWKKLWITGAWQPRNGCDGRLVKNYDDDNSNLCFLIPASLDSPELTV